MLWSVLRAYRMFSRHATTLAMRGARFKDESAPTPLPALRHRVFAATRGAVPPPRRSARESPNLRQPATASAWSTTTGLELGRSTTSVFHPPRAGTVAEARIRCHRGPVHWDFQSWIRRRVGPAHDSAGRVRLWLQGCDRYHSSTALRRRRFFAVELLAQVGRAKLEVCLTWRAGWHRDRRATHRALFRAGTQCGHWLHRRRLRPISTGEGKNLSRGRSLCPKPSCGRAHRHRRLASPPPLPTERDRS